MSFYTEIVKEGELYSGEIRPSVSKFLSLIWPKVRVKRRNDIWHGMRDDIIMRNVIYAKWLNEIDYTEKCTLFGANQFAKAATFLMLRARLRWQWKSHEDRFLDVSLSVSLFRTATKILLAFISRAAWHYRYYITKVGHRRKDLLEDHAFFSLNFSAKDVCMINFTVFFFFFTFICRVEPRYLELG